MPPAAGSKQQECLSYLRAPRCGFFSFAWRAFLGFRFGLLIRNVPEPRFSADQVLSSAKVCFS